MTALSASKIRSLERKRLGPGKRLRIARPFKMKNGSCLENLDIAYTTYGTLNKDKTNAVLVCHGITGDQHVASPHPLTQKPGWWHHVVGPDRPIDTNKCFVICSNVLGGCMGSSGPLSKQGGKPYGPRFPNVGIEDIVKAQSLLIDALGIEKLLCVVGASMGGMQTLAWSVLFPDRMKGVLPVATAVRHSAQNIAFHEVGRQAIMADPNWCDGFYLEQDRQPSKGLAVARMTAHVTYMSEKKLQDRFGRDRKDTMLGKQFQVESYLAHQGSTFVERFDANSYLFLTRAMDRFDLAGDDSLPIKTFRGVCSRFCLISFTSDWLFPTEGMRSIVQALNVNGVSVSFIDIETDHGHDAFLLQEEEMFRTISSFIHALLSS